MTILIGDCRDILKTLPDRSVQCCVTSPPYFGLRSYLPDGHDGKAHEVGTEQSVAAYVAALVDVFREVRRVLADDGVVFLNLGDSYAGSSMTGGSGKETITGGKRNQQETMFTSKRGIDPGLKPKDLIGVPWRVAFALQADGWWLRNDHIWAKPNPMPESVRDRCTRSHEYVFHLAKSARYFYDADAIREPVSPTSSYGGTYKNDGKYEDNRNYGRLNRKNRIVSPPTNGRNKRTVWQITPKPFPGAHFAVMPPELVEPCIKAGSREGDTVLDPFAGAGTVGLVAARLGRSFIGIELNPEYAEMARRRIAYDAPRIEATFRDEPRPTAPSADTPTMRTLPLFAPAEVA